MRGLSTVEEKTRFSLCGRDRMHSRASGSFRSARTSGLDPLLGLESRNGDDIAGAATLD